MKKSCLAQALDDVVVVLKRDEERRDYRVSTESHHEGVRGQGDRCDGPNQGH